MGFCVIKNHWWWKDDCSYHVKSNQRIYYFLDDYKLNQLSNIRIAFSAGAWSYIEKAQMQNHEWSCQLGDCHPELSDGITALTVRKSEFANFCAAMDTLINQDGWLHMATLIFLGGLCGHVLVSILTLSPREVLNICQQTAFVGYANMICV